MAKSKNGFADKVKIGKMTIEVPFATEENTGYMCRGHYDVQLVDRDTYVAVDAVHRALVQSNAVLRKGKPVKNHVDTVRWILERFCDGIIMDDKPEEKNKKQH